MTAIDTPKPVLILPSSPRIKLFALEYSFFGAVAFQPSILDPIVLGIGLVSTGILWWRLTGWTKSIVSIVLLLTVLQSFLFAGYHKCYEGSPPMTIGWVFGLSAASLPWLIHQWKFAIPLVYFVLIATGAQTARSLARSYHGSEVTGNPAFSSGEFWHSPITGLHPRDAEKTAAHRNRFDFRSNLEPDEGPEGGEKQ
ncbi:hypothetical protein [Haloferula sp. A504]|uniref:hypothetical protein n=1 Tax=Haloferula sp. A504 TaxID=3373601 RepID=UPI0031C86A8E|nr:hypothetical protein [Verrucomicrobiaceae bacterium E54]